jgi:hypothetical protein
MFDHQSPLATTYKHCFDLPTTGMAQQGEGGGGGLGAGAGGGMHPNNGSGGGGGGRQQVGLIVCLFVCLELMRLLIICVVRQLISID